MKSLTSAYALAVLSFAGAACSIDSSGVHVFATDNLKEKAERVDTRDLSLAAGKKLHVQTSFGDIHVRAAEGEKGSMHAAIHARGKTQEDADDLLARTSVVVEEKGDAIDVRVDVKDKSGTQNWPAVDFEIVAPAGVDLELKTSSGRVHADGTWFARVELESSFGDVSAENVRGDASLRSSSGKVALSDVKGATVDARSSFGDVVVARIECDTLKAGTSSGKVQVDHASAKSIVAESNFGDVTLRDVEGAVAAKSDSGAVRAERASGPTLRLRSGFGEVAARTSKGEITLDTSSGNVKAEAVEGKLDAKSGFGKVDVDGVFDSLRAESRSGDVHVRARENSRADGWKLISGFGGVLLEAPADLAFNLDASTGFGKIECGYATGAKSKSDDARSLHAQINGGGGKVHAESSSGDVRVRPLGK